VFKAWKTILQHSDKMISTGGRLSLGTGRSSRQPIDRMGRGSSMKPTQKHFLARGLNS
jgi:hypothetical protein